MSIFPYVYYMVSSFEITSDDRQTAIYAGMVTSAFAFAEFSTGMLWGRLSDRVGRKPVLLSGLAGTSLSMIMFGFSPSLPMALVARALGGLLNGNIGVLQTTVAEMITEKEHQPKAYAVMPFVWCLGSILGPAMGGALADPCTSYPTMFPRGTVFDKFPYLLPNLVCAIILVFGVVVGLLFLEETHEQKKYNRDMGLETGRWIILKVSPSSLSLPSYSKIADANYNDTDAQLSDEDGLLSDEDPPGYRTTEGSPRNPSSRATSPVTENSPETHRPLPTKESNGMKGAFTRQVVLNIVGYGILA
ncbi:MAG: hypothetical protein M1814_005509 [Vezdaea aestivalis]|nr:MAG: hypothetical protein M1814_005509 [Vezdaea aestivalis]